MELEEGAHQGSGHAAGISVLKAVHPVPPAAALQRQPPTDTEGQELATELQQVVPSLIASAVIALLTRAHQSIDVHYPSKAMHQVLLTGILFRMSTRFYLLFVELCTYRPAHPASTPCSRLVSRSKCLRGVSNSNVAILIASNDGV